MSIVNEISMHDQTMNDYGASLMTILWADYDDKKHLVFGTLEFYPTEISEISEVKKVDIDFGENKKLNIDDVRLHFCRIRLSNEDGWNLYNNFMKNGCLELKCENENMVIENEANNLVQIPRWPQFTVAKRSEDEICPFLSESWGCCRMHHILPDTLDEKLVLLTEYESPIEWIKERLMWDISVYPELLGSMHLILPNPLIRCVHERMIPGKPNKLSVFLELRSGKRIEDLRDATFKAVEFGAFGMCNAQEKHLSELKESSFVLDLADENTEKFASIIFDDSRGMLEWSPFGNFLMGINIDMRIANAKRRIYVPGQDTPDEVTTYEFTGNVVADGKSKNNWGRRQAWQHLKRTQGKYAKKFGQQLFHDNQQEYAKSFIRELIQQAKNRVIIIDPFFATVEFFKYVLQLSSPVDVTIITGKETMDMKSRHSPGTIGEELRQQISEVNDKLPGYTVNIQVMTGDKSIIHDRFLVIDDQVWFSGNSLNDIGKRVSTIIRLPNPQELLDCLRKLYDAIPKRIISLDEWAERREKAMHGK